MKINKHGLIISFIILIFVIFMTSCYNVTYDKKSYQNESRINLKVDTIICGHRFMIIEVDSVEYLTSNDNIIKISK